MSRVLDVVRIQLVHWPALLGYPLLALAALPLLGWGIDVSNGETALSAHEIYLLPALWGTIAPAHLQTMTQVFPFTLGLGVTRRAFAAATALVVLGQALLLGLVLVAFDVVERLTGGWGREARIFGLDMLGQGNPPALWLVYSGPLIAVSVIGFWRGWCSSAGVTPESTSPSSAASRCSRRWVCWRRRRAGGPRSGVSSAASLRWRCSPPIHWRSRWRSVARRGWCSGARPPERFTGSPATSR
jgi:hypothetical protein